MKIRRAVIEDAEAIYRLNKIAMNYDYPPEQTEKKLAAALADSGQCILAAEEDGELVCYIHLEGYDTLYFPHMKNILAVAVAPEFRRRGIATALLSAGEAWAKETGAVGVRLVSGIERVNAHTCYHKVGYTEKKLQKNFRKLF